MSKGKTLKLLGIVCGLSCFFLIGSEASWFLPEGSFALEPTPKLFKANFQGGVTDFDFKTKRISVEGSAAGIPIGESTFAATGTIEGWNTGSGTVAITTKDKSTITANLIGHLVGADSFFGTYTVTSGTGRFQTAIGGRGIVSGTFDLRTRSFQGQASGNIIY